MIIIKGSYIGNKDEAFVENGFCHGLNIVYSNNNDKGKTILMQSIMYALGNEPMFPGSFPYKDYYHIIDIAVDDQNLSICRKDRSIIVRMERKIFIYDNLSDFKQFFSRNLTKLPTFIKDSKYKMADLELFIQLFFVGQDGRDSSKIFNTGYYKKEDFINMIYALAECDVIEDDVDTEKILKEITKLKNERNKVLQTMALYAKDIPEATLINYTKNKDVIADKMALFEQEMDVITELKKDRARLFNRKVKNEHLIKELNSLNRGLSEGALRCLDCNSDHIGYENAGKDFMFEVSDVETRKDILESIRTRINSLLEEIERLDRSIENKQKDLNQLLIDEDMSLENLLFYKNDVLNATQADKKIYEIDEKLSSLQNSLNLRNVKQESNKQKQKNVSDSIFRDMNEFYKKVNSDGILTFNSLFTTKDRIYSGSEITLFYLSKLYALAKNLKHVMPIVVDGFREGEISTGKEDVVIEEFSKLPNQIIFTATLKDQEIGKYDGLRNVNKMDYSNKQTSHILNKDDLDKFKSKVSEFSIYL